MIKKRVRATLHGAISIVNALATCSGSALGISLRVTAEADLRAGEGIRSQTANGKLIRNIVYNTIPREVLAENSVYISVDSEIPMGFGLKSSSAVSDAVDTHTDTGIPDRKPTARSRRSRALARALAAAEADMG